MSAITERVKIVIQCETGATRRFKELEVATRIPSETWRTYWNRDARPSAEMIESVCKKWPQYAFWISTGITDSEHGHIAPPSINSFFPVVRGVEQKYATEEFKYLIEKMRTESENYQDGGKRKREIENELLKRREEEIFPLAYLAYEKLIRELGESGRSEFFLLESNPALKTIRRLREREEKLIRALIKEQRTNLEKNS